MPPALLLLITALAQPEAAMIVAAEGADLLARGEVQAALQKLERAKELDPASPIIYRDLAIALGRAGRYAEAERMIAQAIDLGDADPEARELHALLLARSGRKDEALAAAQDARSWEGDLIAASLGDRSSASRATEWTSERTSRGALTALVLAAYAGEAGERTSARNLVSVSELTAAEAGSVAVLEAARALRGRLDGESSELLKAGARARSVVEHATNPRFTASGSDPAPAGLRLGLLAEAAVQAPIGTARLDGAFRFDQHLYLTAGDALEQLDISGFTLAASAEVPISTSPEAASVGVAVRFRDLFGDRFRRHYATTIEGGPTLTLPFDLGTRLVLGVFGVGTDFIDGSPPDAEISSQNRDRIGQRAVAALIVETEHVDARAEALFLRDDAYGEAFDVRGGAISGRVEVRVPFGISLRGGLALTLRRFGPVGDPTVLGAAATRSEFRTAVELAALVPIGDHLALLIEELWISSSARPEHSYSNNVLTAGVEVRW